MLSRNEAFSVRSSFFRHSNLKKQSALTHSFSFQLLFETHWNRKRSWRALWTCSLQSSCFILFAMLSLILLFCRKTPRGLLPHNPWSPVSPIQYPLRSQRKDAVTHCERFIWYCSADVVPDKVHPWCRTWWLNGSRTGLSPRRLGFVSCMELIVILFTLFLSLCFLDGWFVYRQDYTENFWVSAQTRPHKVLVRIQIKGWLQELFLTFFSFVRQGIYHGIMHRSWRKYSGVLRWLVWVKGAFGTWLRNVLF